MKMAPGCYQCLRRLVHQAAELATDDVSLRQRAIREATKILDDEFSSSKISLGIAARIHEIVRDVTHNPDPYRAMKEREMALARGLYPELSLRAEPSGRSGRSWEASAPRTRQLIPEEKMRAYRAANGIPEPGPPQPRARGEQDGRPRVSPRDAAWIEAFKGGPRSYGDFLLAGPICDAVNLAAISLRLGGRRLLWDAAAARITNVPEANAFLTRESRPGWQV